MPALLLQEGSDRTERALKLSRSKFIKQASSDSGDSSPKAEPRNKRGLPYITIYSSLQKWGVQLVPYIVTCYFIGRSNLWVKMTVLWSPGNIPQCFAVALIISLPTPCLPVTFPPLMLRPTFGSKSIILI
jgi:hypothetical protein